MYEFDRSRGKFYRFEGGRRRYRLTEPPQEAPLGRTAKDELLRRYEVLKAERAQEGKKLVKAAKRRALTDQQEALLLSIESRPMQEAAREILDDPQMNDACKWTMERSFEYASPLTALLAGIAMNRLARAHLDSKLDAWWAKPLALRNPGTPVYQDIVVGGGLHGAIYANVTQAVTGRRPLVFEQKEKAGGVFASSWEPSFYLNSRNRPGKLSVPGDFEGALNVIPGSPIQPSDIDGGEYQTNVAMAFCIRASLALNAIVITGTAFDQQGMRGTRVTYTAEGAMREVTYGRRLVQAIGLSKVLPVCSAPSERILTFADFMAMMDKPFPFRGMDRVAVLGAGDSGKTAIEALVGQGPAPRMSSASVDWPRKIDWYGVTYFSRRDWENANRSRYKGIGRALPVYSYEMEYDEGEGQDVETSTFQCAGRVTPKQRFSQVTVGYNSVAVDGIPYDYVINCTGFKTDFNEGPGLEAIINDQVVGRKSGSLYYVGPNTVVPVSGPQEQALLAGIGENTTSIFRYAPKTAALAATI